MVTAGLAACTSCVGPSSFLSVSVARMMVILALRRPPYIGHSQPSRKPDPLCGGWRPLGLDGARDPQRCGAWSGRLQAVHAAAGGPDEGRACEQRAVLADLSAGRLVQVGVLAAGDERGGAAADRDALD